MLLTHNARNCNNRKICKVCGEKHPTTLHGLKPKQKKSVESQEANSSDTKQDLNKASVNSVNMGSNVISMSIVPVRLGYEGTDKVVHTYALLDNCSQGTLVTKSALEELGITGTQTSITIKTLNGDLKNPSIAVRGLKVARSKVDDKNAKWITLPKTFSRDCLPVDTEDIATPDKISKWGYLDAIANEINQSSDVTVGLLVGANCSKALEPNKIIPSQGGGPYAFRTILGWCIVGPVDKSMTNGSNVSCNLVSVYNIGLNETAKHHFALEESLKEDDVKKMLQKIYEHEFTEPQLKEEDKDLLGKGNVVSVDDRKFLKLMKENTTMIQGHYQVPLPLKDENNNLANNRKQASWSLQILQ